MISAHPTRNEELNEPLTNFWEINKMQPTWATDVQKHFQDTIEFNNVTGRYNVRLSWKGNKLHIDEKKTEQPATYPKRKASRAYLQIQRTTARST